MSWAPPEKLKSKKKKKKKRVSDFGPPPLLRFPGHAPAYHITFESYEVQGHGGAGHLVCEVSEELEAPLQHAQGNDGFCVEVSADVLGETVDPEKQL